MREDIQRREVRRRWGWVFKAGQRLYIKIIQYLTKLANNCRVQIKQVSMLDLIIYISVINDDYYQRKTKMSTKGNFDY